jgi:hypothetical protein
MKTRPADSATAPVAHEQSIIEDWLEDDGVYVSLRRRTVAVRRAATAARGAESEVADSAGSLVFLPLPTLP